MNNNFRLINNIKKFIFSLDNIIVNFPKKDLVLKDKIYITSYEVLELIFLANNQDNKITTQKKILSKLNMLDFYFERAYKLQYISEKQCLNKCNDLLEITKMIYGWIKNG